MTSIGDDCKTCQICFSTHYKSQCHIASPAFHLHFSLLTARLTRDRRSLILPIVLVKEKLKVLKG